MRYIVKGSFTITIKNGRNSITHQKRYLINSERYYHKKVKELLAKTPKNSEVKIDVYANKEDKNKLSFTETYYVERGRL